MFCPDIRTRLVFRFSTNAGSQFPASPVTVPDRCATPGASGSRDDPDRFPDGTDRFPDRPDRFPDGPERFPDGTDRFPDGTEQGP